MNTERDFVVVDVETSGFDPAADRELVVHAAQPRRGSRPHQHPRPDPNHACRPALLRRHRRAPGAAATRPHLVAHNAAFDYAFLTAEARRCDTELPVTSVLCTLELAALLDLDLDLSLAALARHWNIPQARPHDALDDARVLATVLRHALARASELENTLPIRSPATLPPVEFHTAAA